MISALHDDAPHQGIMAKMYGTVRRYSAMNERLTRDRVPVEETWNLQDIYATPEHWDGDAARIEADIQVLSGYRGRLGQDAASLLACLRAQEALVVRMHRLHMYAYFSLAADGSATANQAMSARAATLEAQVDAARTFVKIELAALPATTLAAFMEQEAGLVPFKPLFAAVERERDHLLLPETEAALASLQKSLHLPTTVWGVATAVDMQCAPAHDARGRELPVSIAGYVFGHAQAADRTARRTAYASLVAGLRQHRATLATALATHIEQNVVMARLRGYASATEMILAAQRVPLQVYQNVLDVVHDEMAPHVRRLMKLRARVLDLARVERYDMEAPLDPDAGPDIAFAESAGMIKAAVRILGEDYVAIVAAAFENGWIDRADNTGKRSGAFCWPVYGVHPYVFTTWRDTLRSAFTLAHELGHAGHYLRALRDRPLSTYALPALTLVLEGPSTANELLLHQFLLDATTDPRLRRSIILQSLPTFTHNMVTHLLEARFERRLYELAEAGRPLTLGTIMDVQSEVFEQFYAGSVVVDDGARLYWAQQPHFYMNLYPYSYAAGLSLGFAAVEAMRAEGQPGVDRWLDMMALGSTRSGQELARVAGVDMSSPEPLRQAAAYFGLLIEELERSFAAA
jgi:oligoendopeptidase F